MDIGTLIVISWFSLGELTGIGLFVFLYLESALAAKPRFKDSDDWVGLGVLALLFMSIAGPLGLIVLALRQLHGILRQRAIEGRRSPRLSIQERTRAIESEIDSLDNQIERAS